MDNKFNPSQPTSSNGSQELGRLIMQLRKLERQPHTFGLAGKLTPSEIHTIDAIGCDEAILMSELAARLAVTKGAITQLVDRLEAKSLVRRSPHPTDSRSSLLCLTDLGKEAYLAHEAVHLSFYDQLRSQLTEQEIEVFEKSITLLNRILDK